MPIDPKDEREPFVKPPVIPASKTARFARALAERHALPAQPSAVHLPEWSPRAAQTLMGIAAGETEPPLSRPPIPVASWLGLSPPAPEPQALSAPPSDTERTLDMMAYRSALSGRDAALARPSPAERVPLVDRPAHPAGPDLRRQVPPVPMVRWPPPAPPMPAPVAPMEHKSPPMTLFRANDAGDAARGDGVLIQRSAIGDSPTGAAHASAKTDAAPNPHGAQGGGEGGDGGDVSLLAGEVWALLKRRLAVEAERAGRH